MSREVAEWLPRNDDAAIPDRVKLRVYDKTEGRCAVCTTATISGQYDHVIPLILGGAHREANLQWLCTPCHGAKTKLDVKLKAKVARVRKRHLGIKKPSHLQSRGFEKRPPQRTASRAIEKRSRTAFLNG